MYSCETALQTVWLDFLRWFSRDFRFSIQGCWHCRIILVVSSHYLLTREDTTCWALNASIILLRVDPGHETRGDCCTRGMKRTQSQLNSSLSRRMEEGIRLSQKERSWNFGFTALLCIWSSQRMAIIKTVFWNAPRNADAFSTYPKRDSCGLHLWKNGPLSFHGKFEKKYVPH